MESETEELAEIPLQADSLPNTHSSAARQANVTDKAFFHLQLKKREVWDICVVCVSAVT